jgi:PRTRC genetic system ThiF family protein
MHTLSLDYLNASRLLLPVTDSVTLALAGCGGTGSWLAPIVVRVARLLKEKFGKRVEVLFFDPDRVEAKNCYRQNFCEAEIGQFKAESLAFRYGLAWGMDIAAVCGPFDARHLDDHGHPLRVLIGCVDNPVARKSLAGVASGDWRRTRTWWLDCGNEKVTGQALLGGGAWDLATAFQFPGFCTGLPLPSVQHPELLIERATPETPGDLADLSCADLALLDSQGLAINPRVAAEAGDYLVRMLLTGDLRKFATYLDLESGAARSAYLTPDALAPFANGPEPD